MSGSGELIGYFGYGSLVNRLTLRTEIVAAYPARLNGWQRYWRHRPKGAFDRDGINPAVLTAGRKDGAAIDGMLVIDRLENLPAVDVREHRYRRVEIAAADITFYGQGPEIDHPLYVYEADYEADETAESRIIRSYLDAVMQGFLREFGQAGLKRFVHETAEFHMPLHEDRLSPVYPRAISLKDEELALIDSILLASIPVAGR